jgi:hypothetical protein
LTVKELLVAEKSTQQQYADPKKDIFYQDPDGLAVMYMTKPLRLLADGEPVDLKKMQIKIADFGKGLTLSI